MFNSLKKYPLMLRILSIGIVINMTGMSFLWPLNTIYIHNMLGKSLAVAGLILLLHQVAAMVGNLVGGVMYDRWGGVKLLLSVFPHQYAPLQRWGSGKAFMRTPY